MKKIIIINHYGITPELPGATKHYEMAKKFVEKESHDVEFWICGYNHHTGKNHESLTKFKLQNSEITDNFKTVRIKSTPYRKSSIARQLNIMIFDLITAFKILFSKNIEIIVLSVPPVSIFNTIAIKLKQIKLVADVEDLWPLFLEDLGLKNRLAIKYMNWASDILYKYSDGVAAVSKGMLDFVNTRVRRAKDTTWLAPLGVNLEEYENIVYNEKLLDKYEWKNKIKIMYIGAHGKANDIKSILKTIEKYNEKYSSKDVSFIFIGDGDQKENLIKYRNQKKLENVFFEDAIPSKLVPMYLSQTDICLTNLQKVESFKLVRPNKIFQYMAVGKPIISGIWGEAEEIIKEAQAGIYVDFTKSSSAIDSIHYLIVNEELRKKYGVNGRKYIEKNGDRIKIFNDYYSKLIKLEK